MDIRHLLGVLALYLAIQCCWLTALPPFEAPDEPQHYDYVRFVAVNGHLPDKVPSHVNEGNYFTSEWTQETFYYWALGLVLRQTGVQDTPPGAGLAASQHGVWAGGSVPTAYVHAAPLPPHLARGLLLTRLASVLFGLGTLLCVFGAVYACGRRDSRVAALATSCVALVPQYGIQHIFTTNDTAAAFLASATALLVVSFLVRNKPSLWLAGAIGATSGLAIATKLTAGVMLAALPLALWRKRRTLASMPRALAWCAGLLLTGGEAFGRNWLVFGDPLATPLKKAIVSQFALRAIFKPGALSSYWDLVKMLFHGLWVSIGWAGWNPDSLWLSALSGLLTAFLLASILAAARLVLARPAAAPRAQRGDHVAMAEPDPSPEYSALVVMLQVFALHTAVFLVSISIWAGYSARYFLPMIVPVSVVSVMGARSLCVAIRARLGVHAGRWTLIGVLAAHTTVWLGTFTATVMAFHFEGAL